MIEPKYRVDGLDIVDDETGEVIGTTTSTENAVRMSGLLNDDAGFSIRHCADYVEATRTCPHYGFAHTVDGEVVAVGLEAHTYADPFSRLLISSNGEPIPNGTVVALGPVPSRRQPEIEAFTHVHPASRADDPRRVVGVIRTVVSDIDPPRHQITTTGDHVVRADATLAVGAWGWPGDVPGILVAASDGWYVLDRIDEDHVLAYIGRHVPVIT